MPDEVALGRQVLVRAEVRLPVRARLTTARWAARNRRERGPHLPGRREGTVSGAGRRIEGKRWFITVKSSALTCTNSRKWLRKISRPYRPITAMRSVTATGFAAAWTRRCGVQNILVVTRSAPSTRPISICTMRWRGSWGETRTNLDLTATALGQATRLYAETDRSASDELNRRARLDPELDGKL